MVLRVLQRDTWRVLEARRQVGPVVLRLRTPVVARDAGGEHVHLHQVVWSFAEPKSGAMPKPHQSTAMQQLEDRLVTAWERGGHALLVAVLTIDGARQWVFYARDPDESSRRLQALPQYPIEVATSPDPSWSFLHDELLAPFQDELDPALWTSIHTE